jgi:hypothetical protein
MLPLGQSKKKTCKPPMFSDYSTCPTTLPCRSVWLDTLVTLSGTRPYRLRAWCKAVKSQPHFPRILAVRLLLSPVHQGMNIPSVLWGCAKFERPQRGIGAAIALDLGRRGANVVINYSTDKSRLQLKRWFLPSESRTQKQALWLCRRISPAPMGVKSWWMLQSRLARAETSTFWCTTLVTETTATWKISTRTSLTCKWVSM